jgi:hypothetical protein
VSISVSALIPFVGRMGLPYSDGYNIYWRTILKFLRIEPVESIISLDFFQPGVIDYILGIVIFIILFVIGIALKHVYYRNTETRPSKNM